MPVLHLPTPIPAPSTNLRLPLPPLKSLSRTILTSPPDTHLADRTASLYASPSVPSADRPSTPPIKSSTQTPTPAQVRQDLLYAQRSRSELQTRLDTTVAELERLRLRSKAETQRIGDLTAERGVLVTKLRDKDEELRGKAKLLEVSNTLEVEWRRTWI